MATARKPTPAKKSPKPSAKKPAAKKPGRPPKPPAKPAKRAPEQLSLVEAEVSVIGAEDAAAPGAVAPDVTHAGGGVEVEIGQSARGLTVRTKPEPVTGRALARRGKVIVADELVHAEDEHAKRGRGRPRMLVDTEDWHGAVIDTIGAWQKAAGTMLDRMLGLLEARYGNRMPTYEEYTHDQKALAQLAEKRGLKSNQWVRKPFAAAVKSRYNALPIQMTPEAIRKRAERAALKLSAQAAKALMLENVKAVQAELPHVAEPANEPAAGPDLRTQLAGLLDGYTLAGVLTTLAELMGMADDREVQAAAKGVAEIAQWMAGESAPLPKPALAYDAEGEEGEEAEEAEPGEPDAQDEAAEPSLGAWPYPKGADQHVA